MIFNYDPQMMFTQSIDVVDIGNMTLRCTNDHQEEYYITTTTVMGKTAILKIGPIMPDLPMLLNDFTVYYKKVDYKEPTICKEVSKYIQDTKKEITNVEEIVAEELWEIFPDIIELYKNV